MKTIIVTYDNFLLGKGTLCEVSEIEIENISNIVCKSLAYSALKDNQQKTSGMWTVSIVEKDKCKT